MKYHGDLSSANKAMFSGITAVRFEGTRTSGVIRVSGGESLLRYQFENRAQMAVTDQQRASQ